MSNSQAAHKEAQKAIDGGTFPQWKKQQDQQRAQKKVFLSCLLLEKKYHDQSECFFNECCETKIQRQTKSEVHVRPPKIRISGSHFDYLQNT